MAFLLRALNDHIRRLARREIRAQTQRSKRAAAQHRRDIAALKRTLKTLASRMLYLERQRSGKAALVATAAAASDALRFRADGLRSHRARLGLSAKDFGKLVGVSGLTIYHWEAGKAKPRRRQLAALSQVRKLGKRDALRRLEEV